MFSAAFVVFGTGAVFAQQGSSKAAANTAGDEAKPPTVSVKVKVINLLATVRDKHGKIVRDLAKDDFTLEDDGHPVSIGYFSRETDLPLTLGLLVDTSTSQRQVLDQERAASKAFLDQVLREKDTAFLIHFDKEVELLQDLTASREQLEDALESLSTPNRREQDDSPGSDGPGSGGPESGGSRSGGPGSGGPGSRDDDSPGEGRGRGMHTGGTLLCDAVYLASDELMKKQQGRKALIVLSDGVDRGSKESLESAIEAAQRADTLVYSVLFKGEGFGNHSGFGFPGMGGGGPMGGPGRRGGGRRSSQEERPDGKKVLERISKETGGRFFEVSKKEPIDQIYSSIQEELRNQYSLGFTPDKGDTASYHKIALKTKQKDTSVQTRDGFYLEQ